MLRVIGIDFGTSTTYMNVKRYNGSEPDGDRFSYMPVMFNFGESSGYVASIARENADGTFDFGEKASEKLDGSTVYTEIKMKLESPDENERAAARRITGAFFKFLYEQYSQQLANLGGVDDQEETVVSYPVKWQQETVQFMLDAAKAAGFQNVRGMDEAEAAVDTVLCQNSGGKGMIYADKPGYLMLIDMGAGTTDLVVCKYRANEAGGVSIQLVNSWPHSAEEPTFGGREVDAALETYVEAYLEKALNSVFAAKAHEIATFPGAAKRWKEMTVSTQLAANQPVNTCGYLDTYRSLGILTGDFRAFDRKEFETFAKNGLQDYVSLIEGCLNKTVELDKEFSVLDMVLLTGGHSAWYFARDILTGAMPGWLEHSALAMVRENPYRVFSLPNPQTTVSLGLVYSKLPVKLEKMKPPVEEPKVEQQKEEQQQKAEQQKTKEQQQKKPITPPPGGHYKWDGRMLPALKRYIRDNTHLRVMNNVSSCVLEQLLKDQVNVPLGEALLWSRFVKYNIPNPSADSPVEDNLVMTEKGLYTHFVKRNDPGTPSFGSWENFMNNWEDDTPEEIAEAESLTFDENDTLSDDNETIFYRLDLRDLRDFLREQALALAAGKMPKEPPQPALPAWKRRGWKESLQPFIEEMIEKYPGFKEANRVSDTGLVRRMRENFGIPDDEEVYFVRPIAFTEMGRLTGKEGLVLTSRGLYDRSKFFTYTMKKLYWTMFMQENLQVQYDAKGDPEKVSLCDGTGLTYHYGLSNALLRLQDLMRDKMAALEDGRL